MGGTYIGSDTANDDLGTASGFDSSLEVGVVPSVDLTVAPDEGGIGELRSDLNGEGSVGSWRTKSDEDQVG